MPRPAEPDGGTPAAPDMAFTPPAHRLGADARSTRPSRNAASEFLACLHNAAKMRATVGMKLLGMQIGHEADGRTIDNNQAMVRIGAMFGPGFVAGILTAFALGLATLAYFVAFVWFLALLYTTAKSPTHQGLHDQYAHTMVVKSARRAA